METNENHYDEDITIFSPDGRLFQVEYARETIKKAATTIGIKYKDGVLLLGYKDGLSKLIEIDSAEKVVKIDKNIGCAFVGLTADARHLIDYAQDEVAINYIWFNDRLNIKTLVQIICEYKHIFTTYYGLRPFGVVLFLAGIDEKGIHLYLTDPSGSFLEHKAVCEGNNSEKINNYLDKNYKPNLPFDKAFILVKDALEKTIRKKLNAEWIEIGIIDKNNGFYKLSRQDLKRLI